MGELTDHEIILEMREDIKDVKETVVVIRKTLYGNGNTGESLSTKLAVASSRIDTVVKILTFVGGPLVAAILVYLVGLLVK